MQIFFFTKIYVEIFQYELGSFLLALWVQKVQL